jgi:hypothetical protein
MPLKPATTAAKMDRIPWRSRHRTKIGDDARKEAIMSKSSSSTDVPTSSRVVIAKVVLLAIAFVGMVAVAGQVMSHFGNQHAANHRPAQKLGAQASFDRMARCEQLYTAWSHNSANDGSTARGQNMRAEVAMADCQRGDFAGGSAELERLLRQEGLVIPPARTALTR